MLVGGTLNCAKEKKYYTIVQDGRRHIVLKSVHLCVITEELGVVGGKMYFVTC